MNGRLLNVNRFEMWANLREFDDGLRLRLSLADWQQLNFADDQRVRVRVQGQSRVWLRVATVRELPPNVLVTLTNRVEHVPE
ncbi:MAG: hypothetical protein K8U57_23700 [Planctomycetes bacterium]|nr:hypothetical protein [Planctomycetota bacterium]